MDYEPSELVQKVMLGTKMQDGQAQFESPEETERQRKQVQKWRGDLERIEIAVRMIKQARGPSHRSNANIKQLVT